MAIATGDRGGLGALVAITSIVLTILYGQTRIMYAMTRGGLLFAFLLVNVGVIVLRRTQPDLERGFRVPFVPSSRSSARCCAST